MRRWLLTPLLALPACAPDAGPSPGLIDGVRVLAVRAEPAEAAPGSAVRLVATVADADGVIDDIAVDWAWCAAPKPPTENNAVAAACLADGVTAIGAGGPTVESTLPADGCRLFGPESPGPGLRPRDPDVTGGYHQPVRLVVDGQTAFGAVRLRCNLAQAPLSVAQTFAAEYTANAHPALTLDGPAQATPGAAVAFTAEAEPPEDYLRFDPAARALETREEQLIVSWFVTGGALDGERSDVTRGPATVIWTAPAAGRYSVIAVLRDSRGGVAVREHRIEVR